MKKSLPFLFLASLAILSSPVLADDVVLKYHVTGKTGITTIAPPQPQDKRVRTLLAQESKDVQTVVTLLPEKFGVRTGDAESIYDLAAKVLYKIDHAKKTWQEVPLHAVPQERRRLREEMAKRAIEFETYTGTGKYTKTMSGMMLDTKDHDLDLDTLYGSLSDVRTVKVLEMTARANEKSFGTSSRGNLAEFSTDNTGKLMPQSVMKSYNNFIIHVPPLHPDVEDAIGKSSRPFVKLYYKTDDHSGRKSEEKWELTEALINKGATLVEKPEGYTPEYSSDPDINAIFVTSLQKGPTAANYGERIKNYVLQGDGMRAMLSQKEMGLAVTTEEARTQENLTFGVVSLTNDPLTKATMDAVTEKTSTRADVANSDETLKAAKKIYKDYVYFLDVFRARNIITLATLDAAANKKVNDKEVAKALKMYVNALTQNPWLATVYADLGDAHSAFGDSLFAWACWNAGLRLKPDLPHKAKLEKLKASIEKEFPEYF